MSNNDSQERRRYFRVDHSILLSYETVDEQEMQNGIRHMNAGGFPEGGFSTSLLEIDNQIQASLNKFKREHHEVRNAIELLNIKVNALLDLLPIVGNKTDQILNSEPTTVNISASGISFLVDRPIPPQTKLRLRMVLPPNYQYVTAFANVVRCEQSETHFVLAAEFVFILDKFKEILIKYAMQKQSAQLKLRRLKEYK